jgi:hypothetical protein
VSRPAAPAGDRAASNRNHSPTVLPTASTPSPHATPLAGAVARLEQSRAALRAGLLTLRNDPVGAHAGTDGSGANDASLAAFKSIPLLGPLIDSLAAWWSGHPLRVISGVLAQSTAAAAKPMTRQHPWALLLAAVAAGALLAWTRPWRLAWVRRAVYAGLLPQVASGLLARVQTEQWLDLLGAFMQRTAAKPPAARPPATAGASPAETKAAPEREPETAAASPLH